MHWFYDKHNDKKEVLVAPRTERQINEDKKGSFHRKIQVGAIPNNIGLVIINKKKNVRSNSN